MATYAILSLMQRRPYVCMIVGEYVNLIVVS